MKITGPSSQAAELLQRLAASQPESKTEKPSEEQSKPVKPAEPELTPDSEDGDGTKGVIRNSLDGRYKGVADVRLRIVHYEELAAIQNAQQKETAGPAVDTLLSTIGQAVGQIPEPPALAETDGDTSTDIETPTVAGLYQGFVTAVKDLEEQFKNSDSPSGTDLVSGIQGAFTGFVTSLQGLLITPTQDVVVPTTDVPTSEETVETPAIEEAAAEAAQTTVTEELPTADATTPDYQALIDDLSSKFADALGDLEKALAANTTNLPELSAPNGNGKAYDKFLAIYNDLWGITPAAQSSGDETVNIVT